MCINRIVIFFSLLTFTPSIILTQTPLSPQQERGKKIYVEGLSTSEREIMALLSGAKIPAEVLPCSSCHGLKGEGKPEGGIFPSNLTWVALTKNYVTLQKSGRERPPYNAASLANAITKGVDPGNNELQNAMPRYQMEEEDLNDLIAYIKILGQDMDQGITDSTLNVGILLPPEKVFPGRGDAMEKVFRIYFNLVNGKGGIYNRTLKTEAFYLRPDSLNNVVALRSFIQKNNLFALVGSFINSDDTGIQDLVNELDIPLVGAISGNPSESVFINKNIFYLYPGGHQQLEKLIHFAIQDLEAAQQKFTILYQEKPQELELLKGLQKTLSNQKWEKVNKLSISSLNGALTASIKQLKATGQTHVFVLGSLSTKEFFEAAKSEQWFPTLMIPGNYANPDLLNAPADFDQKIYLSYPTWESNRKGKAMRWYYELAEKNGLNQQYFQSQLSVLAASILFTEVLKTAGRGLSRARLIAELESLQEFQTGFLPPLTYSLNKRVGSEAVFIVKANLREGILELVE